MDPTIELSDDVRQALEGKNFWHLGTVNPSGSPQVTTVWVHTREGKILVNSALGRVKPRNIEHDPRVALSWHEHHEGGYHSVQIQVVVETIVGEQAEADIDSLAEKYIGQTPYPWRGDGERRVTFLIEPTHAMVMGAKTVGAPVPLTGRYAVQGAQMRNGLELWALHAGVRVDVVDDGSKPERAARIHDQLIARGYRFVLGPYGSDCTRKVAEARAGSVVWNHGAAADDVQRLPGVVSVATPASRYLVALGRVVAELRPEAAVAIVTAPGRFARLAREGLEREAGSLGIELVSDPPEAEAVLFCGPLQWECERLRLLRGSGKLLGGLSPGLAAFPELLGADPEGVLAPVQWHPDLGRAPELGPASVPFDDYIAAQAYAAALIADRCHELNLPDPLAAASVLRTTTCFGAFELDASGLQVGHRLSVVRWRSGRRELLLSDAA